MSLPDYTNTFDDKTKLVKEWLSAVLTKSEIFYFMVKSFHIILKFDLCICSTIVYLHATNLKVVKPYNLVIWYFYPMCSYV